jgi:histidyl-tRNA synthetase
MRIPVRGCRDVAPNAAAARRAIVARFADFARRHGFAEVETPLLEHADLYAATLGVTSDVVTSELFRVTGPSPPVPSATSRGDRAPVVLRPEGTAGVARAFGPRSAYRTAGETARLWYSGPMFRYERPQRLRLRQFTQLGVECLGDPSLSADVDCISLAHAFLATTPGGKDASLVVNTLGTHEDRWGYNETLKAWLAPRLLALSPLSRQRYDAGNCLRILDSKLSEDEDAMRGAALLSEQVCRAERDRFLRLQDLLCEEGVPFRVDPKLVRGLDYYSSSAFEFVDASGRAVCAGGRYEGVEGSTGVGFAAGLERLETSGLGATAEDCAPRPAALGGAHGGVAVFAMSAGADGGGDAAAETVARGVVRQLRKAGLCSLLSSVRSKKIGKAVGRAVRDGARAIVTVGPDDVENSVVQVKFVDGTSHEARVGQRPLAASEAVAAIVGHLTGRECAEAHRCVPVES